VKKDEGAKEPEAPPRADVASEPGPPVPAVCFGAEDQADGVVASMAAQLLRRAGFAAEVFPSSTLRGELVGLVRERGARLVLVSNLPPSGLVQVRYLCKRLAELSGDVPVLVGIWGTEADAARARDRVPHDGSFEVVNTLAAVISQARELIASLRFEQQPGVRPASQERSRHVRLQPPRAPV